MRKIGTNFLMKSISIVFLKLKSICNSVGFFGANFLGFFYVKKDFKKERLKGALDSKVNRSSSSVLLDSFGSLMKPVSTLARR